MDINQHVTIAEQVFAQEVDDEIVLLDMSSENYFGLDETGSAMWQELSRSGSMQETYNVLLEEYEVEPEQLESDIIAFVQKLLDAGLIEVIA